MSGTTGIINGTMLGVYLNDKLIALGKKHTIKISRATRDTGSKDSGQWEESAAGKASWEVTGEHLEAFTVDTSKASSDDILSSIIAGTLLTIKYSTNVTGDRQFSGSVIVTEWSQDASDGENTTYSYTLKGTGALAKEVVAAAG